MGGPSPAFRDSCAQWQSNLSDELAEVDRPYDAIFTAALAATPYLIDRADVANGFVEAWKQAGGAPVVTIVDNPDFENDPNKCLRLSSFESCGEPRDTVLAEIDPIAIAGEQAAFELLDLTDTFCDSEECFAVIGGANVYRDQDHLTVTFANTMGSFIAEALDGAINSGPQ